MPKTKNMEMNISENKFIKNLLDIVYDHLKGSVKRGGAVQDMEALRQFFSDKSEIEGEKQENC